MFNQKGFTLIEVLVVCAIVLILASVVGGTVLNTRGATEKRAYEAAQHFITTNSIDVKRVTCAGDSDSDGYGTCAILTTENEKLHLACPTGYFDVKFFGATSCKEVFMSMSMQ